MSKELIKQRNLKEKFKQEKDFILSKKNGDLNDEPCTKVKQKFLQEDPNIFLLNNILLAVQFFENYERDIKILREKWFKEFRLESQNKKCFLADSLFRESGAKVKFSPFHGINKNSKNFLHPLRIYITSDNIEAAFDPGNLGGLKKYSSPRYQFTVKMDEHDEKLGIASLILFNGLNSTNTEDSSISVRDDYNLNYVQSKTGSEARGKKLRETEKLLTFLNNELSFKGQERVPLKCLKDATDGPMPANCFYYYAAPEYTLNPIPIVKYRMNAIPKNDQEIPQQCFQKEALEANLNAGRRIPVGKFSRARYVLNSAAFKGYFCDLLIEKLAEPLGFDVGDVQAGKIHEEFAIFSEETRVHVTPAIEICDWNRFLHLNKNRHGGKFTSEVLWPTNQMWEIVNKLPCYAVPIGIGDLSRKNLDHEKKLKLVFPKAEEFLLLHMMHSQIRCYFFILSIYKSFIEPEINTASLGPKHLRHLLFWRVHKNFLAWPDQQPAETLLEYLKVLYKNLQNKFLRDFFVNSRNLFASSLPKDLHKAQTLIKIILQNPIPHILQAITNLKYEFNFYPALQVPKITAILNPINTTSKNKEKKNKGKFEKRVRFEGADEHSWRENFKQMQFPLKASEEGTKNDSIYSTDKEEIVNFNFQDSQKVSQILELFILHYIEMGSVSVHFKSLTQAVMYLFHSQSLLEFMDNQRLNAANVKGIGLKIKKLKEMCNELEKDKQLNQSAQSGSKSSTGKLKSAKQMSRISNDESEKENNHITVKDSKQKENLSNDFGVRNKHCETKL